MKKINNKFYKKRLTIPPPPKKKILYDELNVAVFQIYNYNNLVPWVYFLNCDGGSDLLVVI